MEDDHVDRPGVEERQRLKLTGTNSSIGLIVLIPNTHHQRSRMSGPSGAYAPRGRRTTGDAQSRLRAAPDGCSHSRLFRPSGGATWVRRIGADGRSTFRSFASKGARLKERQRHKNTASRFEHAFCRPGGYGGAAAPDPIPNSAVKRSSADGTSSQDAGE